MKKIILLSLLILSGCATTTPPGNNIIYPSIDHPASPAPVALNNVNWQVVTKGNLDAFAAQASQAQNTPNPIFVIITTDDYKAMLGNLAELKRYLEQQKAIIAYYEKATTWPSTDNPKPKSSNALKLGPITY